MNLNKNYYSSDQDIHFVMTTPEEEQELFRKAHAGDEKARTFLIHNHLLFAAMRAQTICRGALPKDEVISAANFAVMKAFEAFKPELGFRFTTYLRPFIRGEISALWKSKFVGGVPDPSLGSSDNSGTLPKASSDPVDESPSADDLDLSKFNRERLAEVLVTLSKNDAELIRLHYVEEKSFADIGRIRNTTREAVRATHARILVRLKRALKAKGVEA